jgi:hypothetical protein
VAEVAAIALTEDRLLHGTFELCSAGELNRHDVAALIGDVLGRRIMAATVDPKNLGATADAGDVRPLRSPRLAREPRVLRALFEEFAAPLGDVNRDQVQLTPLASARRHRFYGEREASEQRRRKVKTR